MDKTEKNRRKQPRYHANFQCWVEKETVTLFGTVTNLSVDGLFLRTLPVVDTGTLLDIKMSVDDEEVTATGKVCWIKSEGGHQTEIRTSPPGIGIQFVEFKGGENLINEYITRPSIIPRIEPEPDHD